MNQPTEEKRKRMDARIEQLNIATLNALKEAGIKRAKEEAMRKFKCCVCGRVWLHTHTFRHEGNLNIRTCGDLTCGANCMEVKP